MNYLAHAYLSFRHPDILVGNMISDFVKGKQQFSYAPGIWKGIRLHRLIDDFTDAHRVTREARQLFRPAVGLYAGAFMDVVYDHFLALDTNEIEEKEWQLFATEVYSQLTARQNSLPERFARMLPYISRQNWLYNYRYDWGVRRSFEGIAARARYLDSSGEVFELFLEHYSLLKKAYAGFFPDVKNFARDELAVLLKQ